MASSDLRRFELVEGTSSKFWEIQLSGTSFSVRFGRIGTNGQTQQKDFDSDDKAKKEYDKLVAEKVKKGYGEVSAAGGALPVAALAATAAPTAAAAAPKPAKAAKPKAPAAAQDGDASAAPEPTPQASAAPAAAIDGAPARPSEATATASAAAPTSADEDRVHWTDALLRRIFPRRGGVAVRVTPLAGAKKAWAAAQSAFADRRGRFAGTITGQLPGHERLAAITARMDSATPVAGSTEEDADLVAALSFRPEWRTDGAANEAVELSAALSGLAHATTATLLALERCFEAESPGYTSSAHPPHFHAKPNETWGSSFTKHGNLLGLGRLRALLAVSDAATYAAARDAAAAVRAHGTEAQRAASTFLFPTERAWVEEDLPLLRRGEHRCLVACLTDPADLTGVAGPVRAYYNRDKDSSLDADASLLDGVGPAAASFVAAHPQTYADSDARRDRMELLAALGHDDAVRAILAELDQKEAQAALGAAALTQPRRVLRLAASKAAERGKAGEPARNVLAALLRRAPAIVDELLPTLDPEARRAIEALQREEGEAVEDARPEDLPPLLLAPPWRAKGPRPTPPVVREVTPPALAPVMRWAPGERERWKVRPSWGAVEHTDAEWQALVAERDHSVQTLACAPASVAAALAPNTKYAQHWADERWLETIVATHELAALPFVERLAAEQPAMAFALYAPIASTRLAPAVAEALREKKSLRPAARSWLLRHPEHAIAGLLAPALGPASKARTQAEAALRYLAANGHEAEVLELARAAGVEEAVAAVLAFDPLLLFPAKLPKLPAFVDVGTLPRPVLKDKRGALPAEAAQTLLEMLAFSTFEEPYAGISVVREACEPASLARFAWGLFTSWLTQGAPSKEVWCMNALGWLGDDECARRLAQLVREWPGEAAHARAVAGLDVLAAIGSDVALMHLNGIALKVKFKGLQAKAEEKIEQIAEVRGLTREELEDRLAPDLGLDEDGSLGLDFGPRQFRVGFDEQLRPFVSDLGGARLKDLPKPNKSDDAERAKAAAERWSQLKKDAKTAASLQILRLELAMCGKRRFPAGDFEELFVRHPLVFHVVRRLVWATYGADGRPSGTFRVAEDRTYADASDDVWTLPADATVGIPHPLELDADALARWSQVFADYELLQPFAQLGRPIYLPTDAERGAKVLERTKGLKLPTGKVLGLEQRRWRRGAPQDAGVVGWMEKPLPDGRTALLDLDPGLYTGMLSESPEQTLGTTSVVEAGVDHYWSNQGTVLLGDLDPIVFSELVRDLEGLRS